MTQTPHGFNRIQVKTSRTNGPNVRVRRLGSADGIEPQDRYDQLCVINGPHLWVIPAQLLDGRDTITLHPFNPDCAFAAHKER